MNYYKKKKVITYDQDIIKKAMAAVLSGVSINKASEKYQIPRSTLHSKLMNLYPTDKPGPEPVMNEKEEEHLVKWIKSICALGRPVTRDHVTNSVAINIKIENKRNYFIDGRPRKKWYTGFLGRHSHLKRTLLDNKRFSRVPISKDSIKMWFAEIEDYLVKQKLTNMEPTSVFNVGEVTLPLKTINKRKHARNKVRYVKNDEEDKVSVLVTGSAAGQLAPTMTVFNTRYICNSISQKLSREYCMGMSQDGLMNGILFYEYIESHFHPWLLKNNVKLPVTLFVDNLISCLSQPLSDFCQEHQIVLIILPQNSSNILQPMDVKLLSEMELCWKKEVYLYGNKKCKENVEQTDVVPLLQKTFDSIDLVEILKNSFRVCGLHPLSVDEVDFSKFEVRKRKNRKEELTQNEIILNSIESYIDSATLESFRLSIDSCRWTGKTEDKHLFHVWKRIVNNMSDNYEDSLNFEESDETNLDNTSAESIPMETDSQISNKPENEKPSNDRSQETISKKEGQNKSLEKINKMYEGCGIPIDVVVVQLDDIMRDNELD